MKGAYYVGSISYFISISHSSISHRVRLFHTCTAMDSGVDGAGEGFIAVAGGDAAAPCAAQRDRESYDQRDKGGCEYKDGPVGSALPGRRERVSGRSSVDLR